ncbi:MAG TPA: LysR family transcriptional regulator [Halanaerobiales bacterium]|nr:LysR family transcriptional regulator [Halanaerobiales bacterium]HPZ63331.1 LysR family transcriptional regulator [Halanaerobiales bacterium]HQD04953.1 LysR family transcriptional regulator [Halanaerobiales bacterium]
MIDFRHITFLHLCKIKNYTKTAQELHLTQPAVSQHIQYLEELYGAKLFNYSGKTLTLTEKGQKLYEYTQRMFADSKRIKEMLQRNTDNLSISFGATLSIGEFIIPDILSKIIRDRDNLHFNMLVENTQTLLEKLKSGEVNFVLLEGYFDKSRYSYKTFRKEEFIGVCSPESEFKKGKIYLEDLLKAQLILRESGSGTRETLEQILHEKNLSLDSFKNIIEIGNMNVIKKLVADNKGIAFLYKVAVQKEIDNGVLCKIDITDFNYSREFNFVYLKNSIFEDKYLEWFHLLKEHKKK